MPATLLKGKPVAKEIEKEIADWEREAREIQGRLEAETITQERMEAIEQFAARVAEGIQLVGFEDKRKVFRMLEVRGKVHQEAEGTWIELEGLFPATEVGLSSKMSARCDCRLPPLPMPVSRAPGPSHP